MLKILYDDQIFSGQRYGGVSRYFAQLMSNFKAYKEIDFKLSLIYSENEYLKDFDFFSFLKDKNFKGSSRVFNFFQNLNRYKSIFDLKTKRFDLFHPTYYDDYFLRYLGDKPFVFTLHDMIHEIYSGKYFNQDDITINRKKILINSAKRIIAISENTKKDILKYYDISSDKVDVIYHACSLDLSKYSEICVPAEYILFVGDRSRYKNFKFFISAITSLLIKNKDLKIVCAGGGAFKPEELDFFEQNNIKNSFLFYFVDDYQLVYLYKKAKFFIFPSFYEGFGLPILEAFTCECPVVLSNSSCFPEIAKDAAIYFDPNDQGSILFSVEKILNDDLLRKRLISLGLKRCLDFSWEKTSKYTLNFYKSVTS